VKRDEVGDELQGVEAEADSRTPQTVLDFQLRANASCQLSNAYQVMTAIRAIVSTSTT